MNNKDRFQSADTTSVLERPHVTVLSNPVPAFNVRDVRDLAFWLGMVVQGSDDGTILIYGEPTIVQVKDAFRQERQSFDMTLDHPLFR